MAKKNSISTTSDSLTVAGNSGPTLIGIVAPTDPLYASNALVVEVAGLPNDGTVLLSDGITPVSVGETLTVAQLTGLMFKPKVGTFNQTSTFSYKVSDPVGTTATGTAKLAIGRDTMPPSTTAATLTVAENAAATAIGIPAPTDPNYTASQLSVTVAGLPSDGTVLLSNGTAVTAGETLSVAQLTGLLFKPTTGASGQSSTLSYKVGDPAGLSVVGTATLAIGSDATPPATTPATLTVSENSGATSIGIAAPTDPNYAASQLTVTVTGLPTDGTVYLSDGITAVPNSETLTVAQLTGLEFTPTPGVSALSEQFAYSVSDPAGNTGTGTAFLSIAPPAGSSILTVGHGTGYEYQTIAAAIAGSQNGDVIQVAAGTYTNDYATINDDITLEGVGGMVNMVSNEQIPNGKAILVTNGNDTINNFSFSGAFVDPADANGAGIRYQAANLTLNDDYFFDNQEGLLGAASATGTITINNSEFAFNGVSDPSSPGYGFTHNLYVGDIAQLTVNDSLFYAANIGHEIKSRAANTTIENSTIADGATGTGSYSIDLPNGGNALIANNVIEKGPNSQQPIFITIGEEGVSNTTTSLEITGNTFLNDLASPSSLGVRNDTSAPAQITDNQFYGLTPAQISAGPSTQAASVFLSNEPNLLITQPWSA